VAPETSLKPSLVTPEHIVSPDFSDYSPPHMSPKTDKKKAKSSKPSPKKSAEVNFQPLSNAQVKCKLNPKSISVANSRQDKKHATVKNGFRLGKDVNDIDTQQMSSSAYRSQNSMECTDRGTLALAQTPSKTTSVEKNTNVIMTFSK